MTTLPDLVTIERRGRRYRLGTAEQIATHLGGEIRAAHVEDWGQRGLIQRWNLPGRGRGVTYFDLGQASKAEVRTGLSTRGRKRQLDITTDLV